MGINAHQAFYNASGGDNYLQSLTVEDDELEELRAARDEIRETIKTGFRHWTEVAKRDELFEAVALATMYLHDAEPALRPKFRMQGSWSYHTLNKATFEPPQEIDLDDGVFLPVSFLTQNGSTHPAIVSDQYFAAVETILSPLCDRNDWTLNTEMSSCVRVEVRDGAHIDLALYAIPDSEFATLVEKAAASRNPQFRDQIVEDALVFDEEIYPNLPADHIMLAHRDEGWKPSDPRKLEDWFKAAIKKHGEQLRRVCRHLKGWRDYNWKKCRLSSIALMACTVTAYDESSSAPADNRDDKAIRLVAERLPELINRRIENPVVEGQFLDEGWSAEMRSDFVTKAQSLLASINAALDAQNAAFSIGQLRAEFGDYLPNDSSLLKQEEIGAPAILTSGILKDLGSSADARSSVKLGGDNRYG